MPGRSGLDVVPQLRREVPTAKIVMFSLDTAVRERAIAAGAHTFIPKDAPMDQILEALRPPGPPQRADESATPDHATARSRGRRRATIVAAFAAYLTLVFAAQYVVDALAGAPADLALVLVRTIVVGVAGAAALFVLLRAVAL
jgi:CheY-like chemotaxis protein